MYSKIRHGFNRLEALAKALRLILKASSTNILQRRFEWIPSKISRGRTWAQIVGKFSSQRRASETNFLSESASFSSE